MSAFAPHSNFALISSSTNMISTEETKLFILGPTSVPSVVLSIEKATIQTIYQGTASQPLFLHQTSSNKHQSIQVHRLGGQKSCTHPRQRKASSNKPRQSIQVHRLGAKNPALNPSPTPNSPRLTPGSKHFGVKYHWFRSRLKPGERLQTKDQLGDILTKPCHVRSSKIAQTLDDPFPRLRKHLICANT
jgi:hypothetical protein